MKDKTKVLLIHNIITPYRLPLFQELSNEYDLTVLFCKGNDKNRLWDTSLNNYTFKYEILKEIGVAPFYVNYSILYSLVKSKFDVIIIADPTEAALSVITCVLYSKILRKPIIIWSGQTDREIYFFPKLKDSTNVLSKLTYKMIKLVAHKYHKAVYRCTNCFIAYSNRTKFYLKECEVNESKIFVGTQIMPQQLLVKPNIEKENSEFKDKKVVLYIGYINKRKGIKTLIEAFKDIKIPNIILLIVGSGEEKNNLKKITKDDKNIEFIENVKPDKRAYYYSIADIFVLPTLHDVWGFVTNEALYYDLPVIVSSSAASSELIENYKTGFVVEKNNVLQLKNVLTMFLSDQVLQSQVKDHVKCYNKDKIVNINNAVETFKDAIKYSMENFSNYNSTSPRSLEEEELEFDQAK